MAATPLTTLAVLALLARSLKPTAFTRIAVLALLAKRVVCETQCYYPDGNKAANFTTCSADATYAACCRPEDACLSNGYCLQQGSSLANRIIRGACTDINFENSACPAQCRDTPSNTAVSIYLAYDSAPNGNFCCATPYNYTSDQCNTQTMGSTTPFKLGEATVIYNRNNGALLPQNWTEDSTSAAATVTITSEPRVITKAHTNAALVGVAVPLAVLLLAALIGCAVLWRQLKRLQTTHGMPVATEKRNMGFNHAREFGYAEAHGLDPHYGPVELAQGYKYIAEAPTQIEAKEADSRNVSLGRK